MAGNATEAIDGLVAQLRMECIHLTQQMELCSGPAWQAGVWSTCRDYDNKIYHVRRSLVGIFGVLRHPDQLYFNMTYFMLYVVSPLLGLWWFGICLKFAWKLISAKHGCSLHALIINFRALCKSLTASGYFDDIEEPLRSEMIEVVRRQRRDFFLRLSAAISLILPMICLWFLIQVKPWQDAAACTGPGLARQQSHLASCMGPSLFMAMCMCATTFPGCVGAVFMAATHTSVILGIAWHRIDVTTTEELGMHSAFFVHLRLAAGLCSGSIPETVVLNSLLLCLELVLAEDMSSSGFGLHLRQAFMYCLFIWACTASYERSRLQEAKHFVTGHASWRQAHTAKDILNMMCDAVVELCNFAIVQPCPKLATLTLRQGSAHLKGTQFLDLVCDADRERCSKALTSTVDANCTVHVDLRDSLAGGVRVQLFITSVPTLSGIREHVIGIREETDATNDTVSRFLEAGPARQRRQALSLVTESEPWRSPMAAAAANSDHSGEVDVDFEQSSCASVLDYLKASPSAYQNNALLWLAKDDTLTIVGYSLPFLQYFGPSFSALAKNFREWVAPECSEAFAEWLDDRLTEAAAEPGRKFRRLCLYPPHLSNSVKILCEVQFLPVEEDDPEWAFVFDDVSEDAEVHVPTVLVIDKVTYKWNRARTSERVVMPSRALAQVEVRSEVNVEDLLHL
eukprot:TRINITY_DN14247_c0_g1_i1.p1 TRINITY_DN14247_c0_g1~~TRINITY_DN14247_c0_g1_i1.p1  ORF type:complete len:682 (-),score=110.56 TRINITY_DN14247_c0_g1_i1:215-2260(-)